MATPTIINWSWANVPVGGTGGGIVYFDRTVTDAEVSVDGGGTWHNIAAGAQPVPTVGGTVTLAAIDPARPNRVTLSIADPSSVGIGTWKVRGVNADGPGAAADFSLVTYVADGDLTGVQMVLPHSGLLVPTTVAPEADGPGFLISYIPRNTGVTNTYNLDFGGGIAVNIGTYGATAKRFTVVVRYSAGGVALDAMVLRGNGSTASAAALRTLPDGTGYYLAASDLHSSGSANVEYRRYSSGSWTSIGATTGAALLFRLGTNLTPSWAVSGTSMQLNHVLANGDAIIRTARQLYKTGAGVVSASIGGMPSTSTLVNHRVSKAGGWVGFYAVNNGGTWGHAAVIGSPGAPGVWWARGSGPGYGSLKLSWWTGSGETVVWSGSDDGNNDRWWNFAGTSYNGTHLVGRDIAVRHVGWSDNHPTFLAEVPVSAPATRRQWGGSTITPTIGSGSEVVFVQASAAGTTMLSAWATGVAVGAFTPDYDYYSAASVGGVVEFPGSVTTGAAATALGHTSFAGGADGVVVRVSPGPTGEPAAAVYRVGLSTNEVVTHIATQFGDDHASLGGGWAIIYASGNVTAVKFDPPGSTVGPGSASDVYMLSSLTAGGEWGVSTSGEGIPPDDGVAVPPNDPVIAVDAVVAEGASVIASISATDPNAGIIDHPDPVATFDIGVFDSGTGLFRTSGTTAAMGGTVELTNDGAGNATLTFTPHADYDGAVDIVAVARIVTAGNHTLYSNAVAASVDWLNEPDPAVGPDGDFGSTWEDTPVTASFSVQDPDTDDAWTWQLSPDEASPWDPIASTVTVFDTSDGSTTAGTVTVAGGQGTRVASITFTPASNWHGSTGVSIRVVDNSGENLWQWFPIEVVPVTDPPGPVAPTSVTVTEDSSTVHAFSISDGDVDDGTCAYEWQVSADGALWLTDHADGTSIVARLDEDDDTDDLSVNVTLEPRANYTGTTAFWLRCVKTSPGIDDDVVQYSTAQITVTVTPVPDAPSAPLPSRMPTVAQGRTATQTFTWTDPDTGDTGQLRARPVGGTWSTTTADLGASVGVVTVTNGTLSDRAASATFAPASSFRGRYQFDIQVLDGGGLTSPVTRVTGVVAASGLHAELVRLDRSETSAALVPLGPVPLLDPELTWSVQGPDGLSCRVQGNIIRRLAAVWETTADALIAPWAVELHVWGDGQLQVAGPIRRRSYDFDGDVYEIEARGVAAYLERREREDGDAVFSNVEQSEIIASLIDDEQARSYGDLLIDTATASDTGENRTVTFDRGTSVADAIGELQDQLDGPEVRINADRELLTGTWIGVDRRNVLVFTEANTAGLSSDEDGDALTTVAHVDGDAGGTVVHGSASAGTAALETFGRVCARATADRVGTTDGANAAAARLINVEGFGGRTVRFTHLAPEDAPRGRGAWDYGAGDVCSVELVSPRGTIRAHGRIVNKTLRPVAGPQGGFRVQLDVELLAADGVVRQARSAHTPEFVAKVWDLYR